MGGWVWGGVGWGGHEGLCVCGGQGAHGEGGGGRVYQLQPATSSMRPETDADKVQLHPATAMMSKVLLDKAQVIM